MKYILIFAVGVFCNLNGEVFTLDKCLKIAENNNPKVIQYKKSLRQQELNIKQTESILYPNLSFSGSYDRTDSAFNLDNNYSMNLSFSQYLYKGGSIQSDIKLSKIQYKVAKEEYERIKDEITLSVKKAFYNILKKQEEIKIAEEILKRRKENLELIRLKHKAGQESAAAVSQAEADLSQAEYDKMSSEEDMLLLMIELNLLLGRKSNNKFLVETEYPLRDFQGRVKLVKLAFDKRPEMKREKLNKESKEISIALARSEYFPDISYSISYGLSGAELFPKEKDWSFGLKFSLPIFEGFTTTYKVKKEKAALEEQNARIKDWEQIIEKEVETAYSNWILAKKKEDVANKNFTAAKEMYELTKLQYRLGRATYLWLQRRELDLTRAEYNKLNAKIDVIIKQSELEKAIGE